MAEIDIFTQVDSYIGNLFAQEDEALKAALQDMREAGLPEIGIPPSLGKFLQLQARLVGARRILEIGTLGGYSTIWLGRALPEDGQMITLEIDPLHAKVARRNLARAMLLGKVQVLEGSALELLPKLAGAGQAPFDMIFIDADKESYTEYLELALSYRGRAPSSPPTMSSVPARCSIRLLRPPILWLPASSGLRIRLQKTLPSTPRSCNGPELRGTTGLRSPS